MFDNLFVFLQTITDAEKNPVMDNNENPIESRTYSDLLAKFMEGIPKEFQVSGYLRDNSGIGFADRSYSSEQILDSGNNPIRSQAIFVTN